MESDVRLTPALYLQYHLQELLIMSVGSSALALFVHSFCRGLLIVWKWDLTFLLVDITITTLLIPSHFHYFQFSSLGA